jgi:serine/threonine protein kinase
MLGLGLDATLTVLPADASTVADRQAYSSVGDRLASLRFPDHRFRLIRRINSGGQGDIYLALDEALNRKVALKRIKKKYAYIPDLKARLLVEAEVAARLEHPAFLPVHLVGLDSEDQPYFVMRYVEGESNFESKIMEFHAPDAARLPEERAQGLRKLLRHFVDVCYAVAYAHDRGVIHRDIKPANVLVGQFGETYLVDWGMVKFLELYANAGSGADVPLRPLAAHGPVHTVQGGTPPYMSPEQIAGRQVDYATDVYSLGVTLYTLLTGKLAFVGKERAEIEANIERGRFKHPRAVDGRVPGALEAVCLKAMKVLPEQPYATAKDIARDLEDWLADRPIAVYPERLPLRARRWARNHKPVMAGLLVLLVCSVLSLVVTDMFVRHEQGKTEMNFGLARDAVVRLVRLSRVPPKSKEVRDEIARTAIDSTRAFLDSRPRDRAVSLDLAQTYRAIANIGREVGEFENPIQLYRQGAELLGQLHDRFPNDPQIPEQQALNSIDTGEFWLRNGQPARSKLLFESALDKLDALDGNLTNNQKQVKALALVNLATALNELDHSNRARESGLRAVELLTSLGDGSLSQPEEALVLAHTQVGLAEALLGNARESEKTFTQAVRQGEALIKAEHDTPQVKHAFACALRHRAETLAAEPGRHAEGVKDLGQASLLFHSLVDEHPHLPHYHRDLAVSAIDWGTSSFLAGT